MWSLKQWMEVRIFQFYDESNYAVQRVKLKVFLYLLSHLINIHRISCKTFEFDVCVTVHHLYNNINSQLDATIIILLAISIS